MQAYSDSSKEFSALMDQVNSPAGQELLALFRKNDSPQMQAAMEQASQGNYEQAKSLINGFLATPEAAALLKRIRGG